MPITLGSKPVTGRNLARESSRYKFVGNVKAIDGDGVDDLYYWMDAKAIILHRRWNYDDGASVIVYPTAPVGLSTGKHVSQQTLLDDPYFGELWAFVWADPTLSETLLRHGHHDPLRS